MLNKTIIQGRLTRDPELRATQSGTPVAGFTVAWSEKYKEAEQVVFIPCVAWGKLGELVSRYFAKGQEALVEGKLVTRHWEDKQGNKRETIELIAERVHFCGPKKGAVQPAGQFEPYVGADDDIPF